MAIDYASAKKLIQLAASSSDKSTALMLGRQNILVAPRFYKHLDRVLQENGFGFTFEDVLQADGFAETLFTKLGYKSVVSMDFSDFEGAELLHDLNDVVPKTMRGKFKLIFDGGTTEHVFDVASCMRNIFLLLEVDGIFSSCVPADGWFGHGYYQFGPELVYSYWKNGCDMDVLNCSILPILPRHAELAIPDPTEGGKRSKVRSKVPGDRAYLYYEVQKNNNSHEYKRALQTDYVAKWATHDSTSGRSGTKSQTLRKASVR